MQASARVYTANSCISFVSLPEPIPPACRLHPWPVVFGYSAGFTADDEAAHNAAVFVNAIDLIFEYAQVLLGGIAGCCSFIELDG